eukprot:CAMPEP_0195099386 /NCGR_PEP_ID=MMETSP0448-20130528/58251_1 /TAXON_ID=66468 /ORGANISM="Heterocapsa triquestra, Strain CCMP 448" /LENGTH=99 /DNA_ID=CAMNT_0040134265 /DNA_START=34 /DNA_END=329 /DNA_ORIENTATION=+
MTLSRLALLAMAPADKVASVVAVKNTFLHFDDEIGISPRLLRRGSRANTEPSSQLLPEGFVIEPEDSDEDDDNRCGDDDPYPGDNPVCIGGNPVSTPPR